MTPTPDYLTEQPFVRALGDLADQGSVDYAGCEVRAAGTGYTVHKGEFLTFEPTALMALVAAEGAA